MNVSRLPGYSRLEEELEADDLLRKAAVEVTRNIRSSCPNHRIEFLSLFYVFDTCHNDALAGPAPHPRSAGLPLCGGAGLLWWTSQACIAVPLLFFSSLGQ